MAHHDALCIQILLQTHGTWWRTVTHCRLHGTAKKAAPWNHHGTVIIAVISILATSPITAPTRTHVAAPATPGHSLCSPAAPTLLARRLHQRHHLHAVSVNDAADCPTPK